VSEHFADWDAPTLELALEEVTVGLPLGERSALASRVVRSELEELELAVAELAVAGLGAWEEPAPELLDRLRADAREQFAGQAPAARGRPAARRSAALVTLGGWLLAASLLVVLRPWAGEPSPQELRKRLLASAVDLVQAPWEPASDPLGHGLQGDVVWSGARQEGYLRFRALEPNDPAQAQYQLWIFDASRDQWQERPVDGGVFDVGPGEEVVVPIDAKLEVREPSLFAVTLEAPGGVVVSRREHLLATATPR
jgi:hypothetical protein